MQEPLLSGEHHFIHRTGWLRAAVLGANDGIVSTASLIVGVATASPDRDSILIAGVAGLVAGAMSMAAGEYVSVSSQSDTERADLQTERAALDAAPEAELEELAKKYTWDAVSRRNLRCRWRSSSLRTTILRPMPVMNWGFPRPSVLGSVLN